MSVIARSRGYATSQQVRKRIEQGFGWAKPVGGLRKLPAVGLPLVRAFVTWNFALYNLIRLGGIGEWWNPSPTCGKVRLEEEKSLKNPPSGRCWH
jgi:hypothetical protein